jgi:AcrR family transcriptional regulator
LQDVSSRPALPEPDAPTRRYNSTRRARQAAETREEVLAAAMRLFTTQGWAGTTVRAVAAEAGVAVETVYSGFESKKGLLRAAMDAGVVGDAEPIPFVERDEFHRLGHGSVSERIQSAVSLQASIHERTIGVWRAIMEAAGADPEIESWRCELERGRRIDFGRAMTVMFEREFDQVTLDLLWSLFGPEVYLKLTVDAGLGRADYESSLRTAIERLVATDG